MKKYLAMFAFTALLDATNTGMSCPSYIMFIGNVDYNANYANNIDYADKITYANEITYTNDVTNPKPHPNVEYKKTRLNETMVHEVIINKPYNAELVIASQSGVGKKRLTQMVYELEAKENKNVLAAINGSFFNPGDGAVIGTLIYRHKHIKTDYWNRAQLTVENNNIDFGYHIEAKNSPFDYLLTGGPYLVKDGKNVTLESRVKESFDAYYLKPNPKTTIGIKKDGAVILAVADGRRKDEKGIKIYDLANFLISEGCDKAINLDGGGSAEMVLSGEFYGKDNKENFVQNRPSDGYERPIPNGIVIIEKLEKNKS